MINVLVPVADGIEEMEAVITADILRRAGIRVSIASVMDSRKTVTASRGVQIVADCLIDDCTDNTWDMIALPGGMPGAEHLQQCDELITVIRAQLAAQRWLAAICASPAVVLGRNGMLAPFAATCHPAFQQEMAQYARQVSNEPVLTDQNLVTSQGAGTAMPFALTLVSHLLGNKKAAEVATGLVFDWT